jgi:hypothetical protein
MSLDNLVETDDVVLQTGNETLHGVFYPSYFVKFYYHVLVGI